MVERIDIPPIMRSPIFAGDRKIQFVEKSVPSPGPGQLLIQVKANALCGSERWQFERGANITPGHEAAGIVAAAGPQTHTPLGTLGVIFLMDFCGNCRNCRLGFTNQCLNKRADMGFTHDGGYGPYELIHENIFFRVDPSISLTEATLLLDIVGTGSHAVARGCLVHPDVQSLLITGAGPIGLGVLAVARILFGTHIPILISDSIPYRLELAEQLGGCPVQINEMKPGETIRAPGRPGVDLVIETSGRSQARQAGIESLNQRGVMVCVGHGEGLQLEVSHDLIAPERAVLGSEYFPYADMPKNLELLRAHLPTLRKIITHRFPVESIEEAFHLFFSGSTGKVVIEQ